MSDQNGDPRECTHESWDGAEGPAETLGRPVLLWVCQGCGTLGIDDGRQPGIKPLRARLTVNEILLNPKQQAHATRWSQLAVRLGTMHYGKHLTAREVLMRMGQIEKEFPVTNSP